ncbi:MAG: hypothetical protein ACI8PZ_002343, partial [Myxococcota bacterium]
KRHRGDRLPARRGEFPVDCSPSGLRSAAGTAREFCAEAPTPTLHAPGDRVEVVVEPVGDVSHSVRGGAFEDVAINTRLANRFRAGPTYRSVYISMRGARTYEACAGRPLRYGRHPASLTWFVASSAGSRYAARK